MVTPLGQRMVFQTAHLEAVRAAHDVAGQLQREEGFRKALSDTMNQDAENVKTIEKSESMKAEERRERQKRSGKQSEEESEENGDNELGEGAFFADDGLDFLA